MTNPLTKYQNQSLWARFERWFHLSRHNSDEDAISTTDISALIHELQSHQIELESQNEDLRQAQIALSLARDQYRDLYDQSPVAYLTFNKEGQILETNPKASFLLATPTDELKGKRFSDYIAPEAQDTFYLHWQATLDSTKKQTTELKLKNQFVRIESVAIKKRFNNSPITVNSVLIDISEQKHAEAELHLLNAKFKTELELQTVELKNSNDRLQSILNAAPDAIITIDSRGIIVSANHATEIMFGYDNAELLGQNVSKLMPNPVAANHNRYLKKYIERGDRRIIGRPRELIAKRRGQVHFPISLSVSQIDHTDMITGVVRDLTQHVEMEKEILQRTEDERNRIGRDLHDSIGQSIVGISMKLAGLSRKLGKRGSKFSEIFADLSADLDKTVHELRMVVNNLAPISLDENEIRDVFQLLIESSGSHSGIEFTLNWPDVVVFSDKMTAIQFLRITQEAIQNVIKYAQATQVSVELQQTDEFIRLSICDNGIGIPRVMYADGQPQNGHGLNNMRYRAHVIGANLAITSAPDKGSCIVVTLRF